MKTEQIHKIVTLKPDEEILEVVHSSLVPYLPKFLLFAVWFLVPFVFLFPLFRWGIFGILLFLALILPPLVLGLRKFFRWANTVFIITDRRIIDVDQAALFDRVVSEAPYVHIDDVSYRIKGIAPTIFRFGRVQVKMAGSAADIEFDGIKQPARVQNLINDLRKVLEEDHHTRKEKRLKKLSKTMSIEEIEAVEEELHHRERDEALETLYEEDDHA